MNHLKPLPQRRRGLSVSNATDSQKRAMNSTLDDLQSDLDLISSEWNKVITAKANPLELALAFLDDTSVGLGHRYNEFKHLKSRLANDLQQTVNEHYQAFNTNIASYEQTVEFISESQKHINEIKENITSSTTGVLDAPRQLEDLNETSLRFTKMLEVLSAVEQLLVIPDTIEEHVRRKAYIPAKEALIRGFSLAGNYDLWKIPAMQTTKQILESQKHTLFETLIEDINDVIYSKKTPLNTRYEVKPTQLIDGSFSNIESHLSNAVDIDIEEQSSAVNEALFEFLDKLKEHSSTRQKHKLSFNIKESNYEKLFTLLSILSDMDELYPALVGISSRAKEEMHKIITKVTDEMRLKHSSLMKLSAPLQGENEFGISGQELLSIHLRNVFWEIFLKLLLSLQGHRAVYEISRILQPSSVINESYRFDEIWTKAWDEVRLLLKNYTDDNVKHRATTRELSKVHISNGRSSKANQLRLFSLQNNVDDLSSTRDHANDLKDMLKEMFPGFSASNNMELKSIYLEEEAFEHEETLVPPKIFNMAFILESFLLLVQGSSSLIPDEFNKLSESPAHFFNQFMGHDFLPSLEHALVHIFKSNVENTNPYLLEAQSEEYPVFKAAINFKSFFFKVLCMLNTSHTYRQKLVEVVLKLMGRFYEYYECILFKLLGSSSHSRFDKKIISIWLEDEDLQQVTKEVIDGNATEVEEETSRLLRSCPDFTTKNARISKQDFFNTLTLDTVASFLNTITWINSWLPELKKVVNTPEYTTNVTETSAKKLRGDWSLFDITNFENLATAHCFKLLLNAESSKKFDSIVEKFRSMQNKLLSCLRYDIRARSIYYVSQLFRESSWCPEVASVELDHNIFALTTEVTTLESRLKESISAQQKELVFEGLSETLSDIFVLASRSIVVLNHNGIKKILKNISILQHSCRNISSSSQDVGMSKAIEFFNLCASNELSVINKYNTRELDHLTLDDIKNILRLQLSEEIQRQLKRKSGMSRVPSMSANKRFTDAVSRLQAPHE